MDERGIEEDKEVGRTQTEGTKVTSASAEAVCQGRDLVGPSPNPLHRVYTTHWMRSLASHTVKIRSLKVIV